MGSFHNSKIPHRAHEPAAILGAPASKPAGVRTKPPAQPAGLPARPDPGDGSAQEFHSCRCEKAELAGAKGTPPHVRSSPAIVVRIDDTHSAERGGKISTL